LDSQTQQPVVIKRFLFAQENSDWSGFKAYEREIQVMQGLDHRGIPRYLNSFETKAGFCMVQEYKNAQSLAISRSYEPEQIKQIAISVLEILVYLQNRIPVVIHRDIKPENILVDEELKVYLVDFGFARIGSGEVAMSSVAAGTFGFMAPEQFYNHKLSEATDLYGLGATLICLLTGTKSTAMDTLIDEEGRINFQHLVSKLSLPFVNWLSKMVNPKPKDRFANAAAALEALKPIDLTRTPEVKFSQLILEFNTQQMGEKLTQTVTVSNSVPETLLEGTWAVAPHPNDPRLGKKKAHPWICFEPPSFQSNTVDCKITVDTNRLIADKTYNRQIFLHTNAAPETYVLDIKVHTNLVELPKPPYVSLAVLLGVSGISTWLWTDFAGLFVKVVPVLTYWLVAALGVGFVAGAVLSAVGVKGVPLAKIACSIIGIIMVLVLFIAGLIGTFLAALVGCVGLLTGFTTGVAIKNHKERGFSQNVALKISLLLTGLGMSLGAGCNLGFFQPLIFGSVLGTSIALATTMLYPYQERQKLLANYNKSAQNRRLIKP
ncbi:MAG TPA: serine/threonine protein kinase, partial [Cyanobacteria bacterium UBA8803]|nr:serine/threonine protein kinase [Cyanobacteria bacterium UBA8803]